MSRAISKMVQTHFPTLTQLAQQKVMEFSEQFYGLITQIITAHDEKVARDVLNGRHTNNYPKFPM